MKRSTAGASGAYMFSRSVLICAAHVVGFARLSHVLGVGGVANKR